MTHNDQNHRSWIFVAWLRADRLSPDEQDHEYPAVIVIDAESEAAARQWGESLYAEALATDSTHELIRCEVHSPDDPMYAGVNDWSATPRCRVGERIPADRLY
jgi:hypothetical protein